MSMEEIVANLVQKVERRYYGKYRGIVTDNADPDNLGRLKLTVPSLLGKEVVTGWAYPCAPYGGSSGLGFFFIPEVGAGVWVEFEEGDPEFPIWVGAYWSKPGDEAETPKPNDIEGVAADAVQTPPTNKIIKTLKGHTIQMEDADGEEMITIVEAVNGHVVTMNMDGIKITEGKDADNHIILLDNKGIKITDGVNEHSITMDENGVKTEDKTGNIVEMTKDAFNVTSIKDFAITQGDNSIYMGDGDGITFTDKNGNAITMDSSGTKMEDSNGNEVSIADGNINIKGTNVVIDGSAINVGSSNSSEPLVMGNALSTLLTQFVGLLNTHVHVGNLGAPTGPPVPLATLVLNSALSLTNKTE
jgi:Type VI secretion system/phage-baseplate injector OB domain